MKHPMYCPSCGSTHSDWPPCTRPVAWWNLPEPERSWYRPHNARLPRHRPTLALYSTASQIVPRGDMSGPRIERWELIDGDEVIASGEIEPKDDD